MKKLRIAVILALLLGLVVVAGVAAQGKIVKYDDTAGVNDFKDWSDTGESSMICNGNFDAENWVEGEEGDYPLCWWTWTAGPAAGWEGWHLSQVNMAEIGDTADEVPMDDAMGIFVRNIGGSGPYYAGAANRLDQIVASDYYWVEAQATMWGGYPQIQYMNGLLTIEGMLANSVAFYGIGTSEDPATVTEWRELFVDTYHYGQPGAVPCANEWEECVQVGRYETIWIDGSDSGETPWFHLKAGQKFDTFNVWTVFTFDNILVRGLEADAEDLSDWWIVGDTAWDKDAAR